MTLIDRLKAFIKGDIDPVMDPIFARRAGVKRSTTAQRIGRLIELLKTVDGMFV